MDLAELKQKIEALPEDADEYYGFVSRDEVLSLLSQVTVQESEGLLNRMERLENSMSELQERFDRLKSDIIEAVGEVNLVIYGDPTVESTKL